MLPGTLVPCVVLTLPYCGGIFNRKIVNFLPHRKVFFPLQAGLQLGLPGLVAGLAQKGEHIALIGLHAGLVEGVDLQQMAGQAAYCLLYTSRCV